MSKKVKMVCGACGSDNVGRDGPLQWSVEKQEWVSDDGWCFDGNYCNECGEEDCVEEVEIEGENATA